MVHETDLFLHSFGFLISLIISAPYGVHPKFFESMAQNFLCGLRHVPFSPKWLSQPIAQFTLVLTVCHIRVALQFQFNGTDCLPILFFTDGIALRTIEYISDHIEAFLYGLVGWPSCDRADFRIFCILI